MQRCLNRTKSGVDSGMDPQAKSSTTTSDLFFLQDEKFDFDVSFSPASSKGDEDEVFVGPVDHSEKCASVDFTSQPDEHCGSATLSWSPLTGDQLESVCQEAHRLANQLRSREPTDHLKEEFAQDPEAKLSVLHQTPRALSPIKRQTFCVQDSPMKQLPPAVQRHLQGAGKPKTSSSTQPASRLSTSSPMTGARAQSRMSLRGKAAVSAVLPSKPLAPPAPCSATKTRSTARMQPPNKMTVTPKQSPFCRPSNRAKSCEDLLSDSASVASDMSNSSFNSSLTGKRSLAPRTKQVVGAKKSSAVKAPPPQTRRMTDRKNTSSSSSSVSSFNSSISASPAKGNLNSLNRRRSTSIGPAPSRTANPGLSRRSTKPAPVEPVSSARHSLSIQAKKETEQAKPSRPTPLRKAEVTPTRRGTERTTSTSSTTSGRPQNGQKPKPEPLVLPTQSTAGNDVSKALKPKRLASAGSTDSLPQTPTVGACKSLQAKTRRPSGLPTPVKRRVSAVPTPTAQTIRPLAFMTSPTTLTTSRKQHNCSPTKTKEEAPTDPPDIQPLSPEEEKEEMPLPRSPPLSHPTETEMLNSEAPTDNQMVSSESLDKVEEMEEPTSKAQEVLLLDLPVPPPQEKLLIDLTNTPDLIRTCTKNGSTTQLIDLSSPLIKWSPDKMENNAPLINLSF